MGVSLTEQDAQGKWAWRCGDCGWAGRGCDTRGFASDELKRHLADAHGYEVRGFAEVESAPTATEG